jgi:hypothetical protein
MVSFTLPHHHPGAVFSSFFSRVTDWGIRTPWGSGGSDICRSESSVDRLSPFTRSWGSGGSGSGSETVMSFTSGAVSQAIKQSQNQTNLLQTEGSEARESHYGFRSRNLHQYRNNSNATIASGTRSAATSFTSSESSLVSNQHFPNIHSLSLTQTTSLNLLLQHLLEIFSGKLSLPNAQKNSFLSPARETSTTSLSKSNSCFLSLARETSFLSPARKVSLFSHSKRSSFLSHSKGSSFLALKNLPAKNGPSITGGMQRSSFLALKNLLAKKSPPTGGILTLKPWISEILAVVQVIS